MYWQFYTILHTSYSTSQYQTVRPAGDETFWYLHQSYVGHDRGIGLQYVSQASIHIIVLSNIHCLQ